MSTDSLRWNRLVFEPTPVTHKQKHKEGKSRFLPLKTPDTESSDDEDAYDFAFMLNKSDWRQCLARCNSKYFLSDHVLLSVDPLKRIVRRSIKSMRGLEGGPCDKRALEGLDMKHFEAVGRSINVSEEIQNEYCEEKSVAVKCAQTTPQHSKNKFKVMHKPSYFSLQKIVL